MSFFRKITAICLLLAMLASFAGCAKLEEFFGSPDDEEPLLPGETVPPLSESDPRKPGVYTFFLVREEREEGRAASFVFCELDVSKPALSLFQIPKNLLVNDSKASSLEQLYNASYDSAKNSGLPENECALSAARAVGEMVNDHLSLPIDYHIVATADAVAEYIDLLDGLAITLPFSFTSSSGVTYEAKSQNLPGSATFDFLEYDYFSDFESEVNGARLVLAELHNAIRREVKSENLSVHMIQAKPMLVNDVPSKDGYDIFFLRRLIEVTPENWNIASLCTTTAALSSGSFEVMHRKSVLAQINTFLSFSSKEIVDEVFDAEKKFTNVDDKIVNAIYKADKSVPEAFSGIDISAGRLSIFSK